MATINKRTLDKTLSLTGFLMRAFLIVFFIAALMFVICKITDAATSYNQKITQHEK